MRSVKETGAVPTAGRVEAPDARNVRPEENPETAERRRLTLRHLHRLIETLREEHLKLEERVDKLSELVNRMAAPDDRVRRESVRNGANGAGGMSGAGGMNVLKGAGDMSGAGGMNVLKGAGGMSGAGSLNVVNGAGGASVPIRASRASDRTGDRTGEWRASAPPELPPDADAFGMRETARRRGTAQPDAAEDRAAFGFAIWAGIERAIGNAAAMLAAGREAAADDADRPPEPARPAALFRGGRTPEPDRREVPIESLLLELREAARIADEIAASASADETDPSCPARSSSWRVDEVSNDAAASAGGGDTADAGSNDVCAPGEGKVVGGAEDGSPAGGIAAQGLEAIDAPSEPIARLAASSDGGSAETRPTVAPPADARLTAVAQPPDAPPADARLTAVAQTPDASPAGARLTTVAQTPDAPPAGARLTAVAQPPDTQPVDTHPVDARLAAVEQPPDARHPDASHVADAHSAIIRHADARHEADGQSAETRISGAGQPADASASDQPPQAALRPVPSDMPFVFIPRSERHRARKKRSLWSRLFHRHHVHS